MPRIRCRSVILCTVLIGLACAPKQTGSDAGPGNDAGPKKDAGTSPTDAGTGLTGFGTLLVAYCESLVRCQQTFTDLTSCEAYVEIASAVDTINSPGAIQTAINAGKISVNSSLVPACAMAIEDLPCNASFDGNFNALPGCVGVLTDPFRDGGFVNGTWIDGGLTTVNGEPCIADEQCPTGSVCFLDSTSTDQCAATCVTAQQQCNSDSDCSANDVCNISTGMCIPASPPPGASGQPCGQNDLCETGLVCLSESDGGFVCGPLSGSGGPCATDGSCGAGFVCGPNNVCVAPPANGRPCSGPCGAGLICVPSANLQSGTCMQAATVGQACAAQFQCGGLYSLYICNLASGTCIPRPVAGACPNPGFGYSCDWRTTYCDMTRTPPQCEPFLSTGSPCTDSVACGALGSDIQCSSPDGGVCTTVEMCSP